jgi:hypothetical protein
MYRTTILGVFRSAVSLRNVRYRDRTPGSRVSGLGRKTTRGLALRNASFPVSTVQKLSVRFRPAPVDGHRGQNIQ